MSKTNESGLPETQDWTILVFLSLIWGSSFILIKYGLDYFGPMQVGALRLLIASIAFLPILWVRRKEVDWSYWPLYLLVGFCGSGIPSFLFPLAQQVLSSSVAGILNTLTPLFTLLIGAIIFHSSISKGKILGVIIGFVGAVLLIILGEELTLDNKLYYGLYIILATLCYGTSVNVVKAKLNHLNPTVLMSVSFALTLPFALVAFFVSGTHVSIMENPESWKGLGYVALLSLAGTFYASILFYKMVQRTNPVFGSSVTYVIPIISTIWGIADGESFTLYHVLGMFLILVGVYLSRK